jgi:hypothetical protein
MEKLPDVNPRHAKEKQWQDAQNIRMISTRTQNSESKKSTQNSIQIFVEQMDEEPFSY